MWPVIGGLISGLGSFFGASQSNATNAANVNATNQANAAMQVGAEDFNAAQALQQENYNTQSIGQQEQFQQGMVSQQEQFQQANSNTAYQRASADMTAAGLNPMMMFGSGGAASTPSGAMASGASGSGTAASISPNRSVGPPQYTSPLSTVAQTINGVISNAVQMKTMDKMTDEIANLQAQKQKIVAETASEEKRPGLIENQAFKTSQEAARTGWEVASERAHSQILENSAKSAANVMDMDPTVRKLLDWGAFAGDKSSATLSPLLNVLSGAKQVQSMLPSHTERSWQYLDDGGQSFESRWNGRVGN